MDLRVIEKLFVDLAAPGADVRERAADEITDLHRGMGVEQVAQLVTALVGAALRETAPAAQEAQLHALIEMQTWHKVDELLLGPLGVLRGRLPSAYADYLDDLLPRLQQ